MKLSVCVKERERERESFYVRTFGLGLKSFDGSSTFPGNSPSLIFVSYRKKEGEKSIHPYLHTHTH